ncbi:NupC/NupG family nucleoside CNT transporter [Candidatus Dependentiae bacterium]|nr:NupC/NupG family nucleoside CNT transporter [Candidatus Dependentiae bacterium]
MSIGVYLLEHNRIYNLLGIFVILAIAFLFSNNRRHISVKLVVSGLLLHGLLALAVLKTTLGKQGIEYVAGLVAKLYEAADQGIEFVFGKLSIPTESWGFIFAIKVLPVIVFFGALMSLLFYLGIVQWLVSGISFLLRPLLGTSGAETLCAAANSFLGQTEAPLLVRGYLKNMTKSEFMVVMVSGMGSISGAILAVFARMGVPATHLLAASVMSIPATIVIAKILYPETEIPETAHGAQATFKSPSTNVLDAISTGTSDGLQLALNVGAMLIAFIALIGMLNGLLSFTCFKINELFSLNLPLITLDTVFSWVGLPFGWLLGFTGKEAIQAGELIGTKVAVNELVAYSKMVAMNLPERTKDILTYALCGFSNFSCIGIQIGGIGALVPEKRQWLSELGLRAVLGGALANLLSAMVASLVL